MLGQNVQPNQLESMQAYDFIRKHHTEENDDPNKCLECGAGLDYEKDEYCDRCFERLFVNSC